MGNASPTGPATGGQPVKAPIWMKPRPKETPKEKQKAPRLGEKMKHIAPVFESQTNNLQWTMYDNAKCMLDHCEKIHRKTESLSRTDDEYYHDENELDPEGKPKQKPFVHSSCRLKSPLSCNEMIRKDRRVADIYATIASCQQNGNRLLDEVKEELTAEVKRITKEEIKGLKRIYALEYFEVAFYLGGVLLLEHDGGHIVPNSPYMTNLVHTVIRNHFSLYETGGKLEDGETLSPNFIILNDRVGNHLPGLPFIENVPDEAGGFEQNGDDAFRLYYETSHLKSNEHWANVEKIKIEENDWKAVDIVALSLFNIMQTLTSDLWHKLCKKKEDIVKAGRVKEFLGISKIDSTNKKWMMPWKSKAMTTRQ